MKDEINYSNFKIIECLYLQLIIITFVVSKVTKKNEWKNRN